MVIGILKDIKKGENRVIATPGEVIQSKYRKEPEKKQDLKIRLMQRPELYW